MAKKEKVKRGLLSAEQISKNYPGAGLASSIVAPPDKTIWLPSRCIPFNHATGGGIPYGKIMEIYGEESSGKCCTLDTRLFLPGKGIIEMGNLSNLSPIKTEMGEGHISAIVDTGIIPIVRLITKSGYEFSGGYENHRLKVQTPTGEWEWKYLRDFEIGDHLPIAYNMSCYNTEFNWVGGEQLDEAMAYALGLLCGDGTIKFDHIYMTAEKKSIQLLEFLSFYLKRFLVYNPSHDGLKESEAAINLKSAGNYNLQRGGEQLGMWLRNFPELIADSFHKRVPKLILTSPKEVQIAFIRGYFDTDGSASSKSPGASISSVSRELIRDIQMMLLNMGIVSSLAIKKTSWVNNGEKKRSLAYRIHIRGYQLMGFRDLIGFGLKYKQDKLFMGRKKNSKIMFQDIPEYSSFDAVSLPPYMFGELIKLYWSDTVYPKNVRDQVRHWVFKKGTKELKEVNKNSIPLTNLQALLNFTETKGGSSLPLKRYAYSEFFHDPIVHIELGYEQTRDIEVNPSNSYISGGFISHNTLAAIDFAAVCQSLGGIVIWNDAEQAFTEEWAKANGLDLSRIYLYPETAIEHISDWLADMAIYARSKLVNNEPILFIQDSIAALDCLENINSTQSNAKAEMGNRAKAIYKMVRIRTQLLKELGICSIFINQIRHKVGSSMWEDPDVTPGGRAMKYAASLRFGYYAGKQIKEDIRGRESRVGVTVSIRVKKNKVAPPRPTFKAEIYFNSEGSHEIGFDRYFGLSDILEELGVIERKKGSSMTYYKGELIARGDASLLARLKKDDELRAKLIRKSGINTTGKTRKQLEKITTNLYPISKSLSYVKHADAKVSNTEEDE